jgi:hypothetical protein
MARPESSAKSDFIPSIGRAVDPAWIEHFSAVARRILPRQADLVLRKQPGIVYVPDNRLRDRVNLKAGSEEERTLRLQEYASSMVISLSKQGKLDQQAAMSGIEVPLSKPINVGLKRPSSERVTIVLNIADVTNSDEDYDYQIETERDVFADRFNLAVTMGSTREEPRHHVAIGQVIGYAGLQKAQQIGRALQEPVPLLGIGALNLAIAE